MAGVGRPKNRGHQQIHDKVLELAAKGGGTEFVGPCRDGRKAAQAFRASRHMREIRAAGIEARVFVLADNDGYAVEVGK